MPDLALGLAAVLAAGLGMLGVVAALRPRAAAMGTLAVCAGLVVVACAFLLAGAAAERIALPLGLPGSGMVLALDGLSGFFLLLLGAVGMAAGAAGLVWTDDAPAVPLLLAAAALTLLAGDGFALLLGGDGMAVVAFATAVLRPTAPAARRAALRARGAALLAGLCLIAAVALLAAAQPWGIDLSFAAMRTQPPTGWRAALVLLLTLGGALGPLLSAAPAAGAAPLAAAMAGAGSLALYLPIRVLFDLAGPAQPLVWGVPLLALGAAGAVRGGLRANFAADLRSVAGGLGACHAGLIAVGLGVALAARAVDLTALAALALGGALLAALARALAVALLLLAAGAVEDEAGTRRLARLGGLVRGMPRATLAVLAAAASLAALPPAAGFAGAWLLLQAVLAAPRIGGLPLQALVVLAAAAMALAVALAAAAAVRLVGVAFLGRPRTPRAAAAQEPPPVIGAVLLALAGAGVLVGLFPALALALARPALLLAAGSDMAGRAGVSAIAAQTDLPGYAAPAVALLLGLGLALGWLLGRLRAPAGHRTAPAWDGGSSPPPPWLPFGDPLTQYGGAGFAAPLRALLGGHARVALPPPGSTQPARLRAGGPAPAGVLGLRPAVRLHRALAGLAARVERLSLRATLALALAVLVLLLCAAVLAEQIG